MAPHLQGAGAVSWLLRASRVSGLGAGAVSWPLRAARASGLGAGAVSWLLRAPRVNWGIELSSRPVELTAVGS